MKIKSIAIRVPLHEAESVRRFLKERKLLRDDVRIAKDSYYLYFPVKELPEELKKFTSVEKEFEKRSSQPCSYKDIVRIPRNLKEDLPTSYDVVGDIILIKLPETLIGYRHAIGQVLLQIHKNIRTVCMIKPVAGELRTRETTVIAGEHKTTTTHIEFGLSFKVDVQSAYFSPRLATERRRVAGLVQDHETVVDMFAGVGPFSIMIARYGKPKRVYAIDKNPEAVSLAKKNVIRNNVLDLVEVIHADAKDVARVVPEKADRIIMNLPFSAVHFFPVAFRIAQQTCIIHYYDILKEEEIQRRIEHLKESARACSYELTQISPHTIKTYAPREFYIGIDITARKRADVA